MAGKPSLSTTALSTFDRHPIWNRYVLYYWNKFFNHSTKTCKIRKDPVESFKMTNEYYK